MTATDAFFDAAPVTRSAGELPDVPTEIPRHRGDKRPWIRRPDDTGPPPAVATERHRDGSMITVLADPKDGPRGFYATRASSFGSLLDDKHKIYAARERRIAWAFGRHPELVMASQALGEFDAERDVLEDLARRANEYARGDAAASRGTSFHRLRERRDQGEDLSYLDPLTLQGLATWERLLAPFELIGSEQFVVNDELKAAGTYDALLKLVRSLTIRHPKTGEVLDVLEPGEAVVGDLKGLALDTPIPTPTGWTTMGALRRGDQVFGSDGTPCLVTEKSATKRIGTYIVEFDGGERVVCDREHLWWVISGRGIAKGVEQVLDVETLRDTLRYETGQRQLRHRVPVAQPLDLPAVDLPVEPYLFGCWLGDGKTAGGEITKGVDLFEILAADGHELGFTQRKASTECVTRVVYGLRTSLRLAGLLGHKTIPDAYLRASIEQRTALLRGLMDTDGTWNKARRRAVFCSTDKALAEQVGELCLSLGLKPQRSSWQANGYGKTVTAYGVEFRPVGFNPFRLPRKAEQVTWHENRARATHRLVRSVEPGPDVETACIAVSSANRTYLCGRDMIPTHNSGKWGPDWFGPTYLCQARVYATGRPYSHQLGRYDWAVTPSTRWAVIPYVSLDNLGAAGLHWIDLTRARHAVELVQAVKAVRGDKLNFVAHQDEPMPADLRAAGQRAVGERWGNSEWEYDAPHLLVAIGKAPDQAALSRLWELHRDVWTPEHTAAGQARLAQLAGGAR